LHERGALSDDEYAKAKAAVLDGASTRGDAGRALGGPLGRLLGDREANLGHVANRWVNLQIVTGIVGLIVFLLFLFLIFLPMWNSFPCGLFRK